MALARTSGIYKITCTSNGKFYIGSSNDLHRREWQHFAKLSKNNHTNQHLQNAYNKYGKEAFVFEVIEYITSFGLLVREQYWLDELKPFGDFGFNTATIAGASLRGRKLSQEHKAKVSAGLKGHFVSKETRAKIGAATKGRKTSDETKAKLRAINKGKKQPIEAIAKTAEANRNRVFSPNQLKILAEAACKRYIVTSPEGVETLIKNLSKFCRENGLNNKALSNVAYGYNSHHKGWKCKLVESKP